MLRYYGAVVVHLGAWGLAGWLILTGE
jgi:hypothetical protein